MSVMYPKVDIFKSPLWPGKLPFLGGDGQGRKQSPSPKKQIHKKMAHQKKGCWELGIQQLDPCCFPKVAVAPVTSLSFVLCYMVSSAQPGEVISPIS